MTPRWKSPRGFFATGACPRELFFNDQLTPHTPVAQAAEDGALEAIGPGALGDKLNDALLVLFDLPIDLWRINLQAGRPALIGAIGVETHFETVAPVSGADLQLHPSSFQIGRASCRERV